MPLHRDCFGKSCEGRDEATRWRQKAKSTNRRGDGSARAAFGAKKNRMRKWFKRITPEREDLLANRWLRPLAHRLTHPVIWHFNRRNVARGVALGLFVGFILPVGQIFVAALLAASARGNLLVAAASTLITNPLTFPPIYYAAYRTGSFLLGASAASDSPPRAPDSASPVAMFDMVTNASLPTVLGLLLFGITSATLGFGAVHLAWRISLRRQWRRRQPRKHPIGTDGEL